MFRVSVNGTDRPTHANSAVSITKVLNERWTAKLTFAHEYQPAMRDEVIIYEPDGTTPKFGGIVYNKSAQQQDDEGQLLVEVEIVDWWVYLDWILVSGGYGTATVSLKQVLTDLVSLYLTNYGITLDAGQATGPTGSSPGLAWEYKFASEVIRDLTRLSGGWVASITPSKVLSMVAPNLGSPSAPYALTDSASHVETFQWDQKSDLYANRVTLKCGGDKTKQVTQAKTLTSTDISNGYFDFFAPATPTGGVSGTLDTGGGPVAVTIGGPGSNFIWTWDGGVSGRPRITPGTMGASAGNILTVTYTAQFPFFYQKDAGVTPYLDAPIYEYEDITDADAADDMATGLLAKHYQEPRTFSFVSRDSGWEPGQVVTINLSRFQLNTTGVITEVDAEVDENTLWTYNVKGITGVYQGSPLDYFRGLSGSGSGGSSSFAAAINTSVISTTVPLGGATEQSINPNSGTYQRVINAVPFVAVADMSVVIRVELWARQGGVQVTARLRDLDGPSTAGTSSGVTATTPTLTTFTASLVAGRRYELQITSNTSGAGIYGIGSLQSV